MNSQVSNTRPVVRCHEVTKTYGAHSAAVQALRGASLEVAPGELMLLEGPSGCGKTTLVSILSALLARDGGSCEIAGTDPDALSVGQRTKFRGQNIGFVFQTFNLIPALTAEENAATPLVIAGENRRQALARAADALREVGFDDRMNKSLPADLSGGQQQRVAIVRATLHNPKLIICDEPTSALDRESGHRVMEILRRHALTAHRAVLVVTHDARTFEFADRIAHMEDGRVASIETVRRTAAAQILTN